MATNRALVSSETCSPMWYAAFARTWGGCAVTVLVAEDAAGAD